VEFDLAMAEGISGQGHLLGVVLLPTFDLARGVIFRDHYWGQIGMLWCKSEHPS